MSYPSRAVGKILWMTPDGRYTVFRRPEIAVMSLFAFQTSDGLRYLSVLVSVSINRKPKLAPTGHRKRRAILICLRAAVRGSKAARRAIARGASVTTTAVQSRGGRGERRRIRPGRS